MQLQEEGAADTAKCDHRPLDCTRRVSQWVVQLHGSSNVALLAGITTLGLVTMSVMVACGLAAWLCGVGLRTARGQGAPCNAVNQPWTARTTAPTLPRRQLAD